MRYTAIAVAMIALAGTAKAEEASTPPLRHIDKPAEAPALLPSVKTVQFSDDEIRALAQLLDMAVKAGGLSAAQPALAIISKLQRAQ